LPDCNAQLTIKLDHSNPLPSSDFGQPAPQPGAESGAVGAPIPTLDPDLAELVARWPALPEAAHKSIMAVVRMVCL